VTGVTGVTEIDSVLSTFDPQREIQGKMQQWPDLPLLDQVLEQTGLRRIDSGAEPVSATDQHDQGKIPKKFKVQDQSGEQSSVLVGLEASRNKPLRLVVQSPLPEVKIRLLTDHVFSELNRRWGQEALGLAQAQRPSAERVRARLVKAAAGTAEDLPQLVHLIQRTVDLSLLSNYQKIRLIDQFLEKLENWPADLLFAYPGNQVWSNLRPSPVLWILPALIGAASLFGFLFLHNFVGPLASKVLGEQDLANLHPTASVYSNNLGSVQLANLLAASFSHLTGGKPGKVAAFFPRGDSGLAEQVRMASEKSGRTFSLANSGSAEICVFETDDPSMEICQLPHQGFGRILLTSKKGESVKSRHKLYQAEADLAGVPITDLVLIED
jgi:hypothetical protein